MIYSAGKYEIRTGDEMKLLSDDKVTLQIEGRRIDAHITSASADTVYFRRDDNGKTYSMTRKGFERALMALERTETKVHRWRRLK